MQCNVDPRGTLHSGISAPATGTLNGGCDAAGPILNDVRNVADCVTMRQEIPAPSSVAVVVEPGAEDEVGGGYEEQAVVVDVSIM